MQCVPLDTLGNVVKKGFGPDVIDTAKKLIFDAASKWKELSHVRKISRKNTGSKLKAETDVEDILHLLMEADRAQVKLPRFVAIDINKFPHIPLEEVDGSVILERVASSITRELEGTVKSMKESMAVDFDTAGLDCGAKLEEMTSSLKKDWSNVVQGMKEELDEIQHKIREVTDTMENLDISGIKEKLSYSEQGIKPNGNTGESKAEVGTQSPTYADMLKSGQKTSESSTSQKGEKSGEFRKSVKRREVEDTGVEDTGGNTGNKEKEWTLVENLRKRKIKTLRGVKDQGESEHHGIWVANVRSRDSWDIYLGGLAEDTSKEEIGAFLSENHVEMVDCWLLKSRMYNSVSARVRIPLSMRDKVLDAEFWPKGLKVRSWVLKPRTPSSLYENNDE